MSCAFECFLTTFSTFDLDFLGASGNDAIFFVSSITYPLLQIRLLKFHGNLGLRFQFPIQGSWDFCLSSHCIWVWMDLGDLLVIFWRFWHTGLISTICGPDMMSLLIRESLLSDFQRRVMRISGSLFRFMGWESTGFSDIIKGFVYSNWVRIGC